MIYAHPAVICSIYFVRRGPRAKSPCARCAACPQSMSGVKRGYSTLPPAPARSARRRGRPTAGIHHTRPHAPPAGAAAGRLAPKQLAPRPPPQVEELRRSFTERRHESHHSSDELLRLQMASTAAARGLAPPPPLPPRDYLAAAAASGKAAPTPRKETVAGSLLSGLGFYQTLQQPDGHFAGAARCGRAPTAPCSSARSAARRAA